VVVVADSGTGPVDGAGDSTGADHRPVAQGTRSAVGLSPQVRRRLQVVKDTLTADSGRAHTHIETIEYLLRYWEETRGDQRQEGDDEWT
jgi:hypothetical protein